MVPLERYTFTSCHPLGIFASTASRSLLGFLEPSDPRDFTCSRMLGVRLREAEDRSLPLSFQSSSHLGAIQEQFSSRLKAKDGWSFSLWLTPSVLEAGTDSRLQPILTFGLSSR